MMLIAVAVTLLLFLAAGGFLVAGVYMLAGMAWAFILVGVLLLCAGIFLRSGMNANG